MTLSYVYSGVHMHMPIILMSIIMFLFVMRMCSFHRIGLLCKYLCINLSVNISPFMKHVN